MAREPREQLVLDLLQDGWVAGNTFDLTPDISFGWFDEDKETTQVTVRQPDETPLNGGATGFDAIDAGGGTPHQTIAGTVECHCWAGVDDLRAQSGTVTTQNPREYLTGSADRSTGAVSGGVTEEINRIVDANAIRPTNPRTGNEPVRMISAGEATNAPEPDRRGVFHYVVPVSYLYHD